MTEYDVVVVGAGPAGIQAGIHVARRKKSVLVVGNSADSNLAKGDIQNYFAASGVGSELIEAGIKQAQTAGTEFLDEEVLSIAQAEGGFTLRVESKEIAAKAIILAVGAKIKKLKVDGEKEFTGKGVSYCTDCDAPLYRNRAVVVVGNGSAAADGVLHLLKFTDKVTLVTSGLNVSKKLKDEVANSGAKIHEPATVEHITGNDSGVTGVELTSGEAIETECVFIELGGKGALSLSAELGLELDPETFQFIVIKRDGSTNVPGVFAAGDVTGRPWQLAKAVGEGCVAGLSAAEYTKTQR